MNLENMLNEKNRHKASFIVLSHLYEMFRIGKFTEIESGFVVACLGKGGMWSDLMGMAILWGVIKMF